MTRHPGDPTNPRIQGASAPDAAARVEAAFARACAALPSLRPGARPMLGISAGGDSMALLDLAARRAAEFGWTLTAAHLDHAVRPESADEAEFVRGRCVALGVPLIVERLNRMPAASGSPFAQPTGGDPSRVASTVAGPADSSRAAPAAVEPADPSASRATEETMRRARHEFFARAARASGATCFALAHQLDDRAETFLIRLLAGSGPTGLAAIRPERDLNRLAVVRPLLALRRAELRDYLRARGLAWREDPTNEDVRQKRAWLRREIIPRMDAWMGLEVAPRVARASELIASEADALTQACAMMLEHLGPTAPILEPSRDLDRDRIYDRGPSRDPDRHPDRDRASDYAELAARFPTAIAWLRVADPMWTGAAGPLRRRLVRQWLWRAAGRQHPPGREAVEEALKFIERGAPGTLLRTVRRLQLARAGDWIVAFPEEPGAEGTAM